VGLTIEKATGALPTGRPMASVTVAISVEVPVVVPTLFGTTLGVACTVIMAGVMAVMATERLSLRAVSAGSIT
jgi:hypothetical protein